ncbi:MAG TPA: ROK family protein [Vicinamibacterales bacterium]|nr:ROK family protein [Vicinamibacterales bacterium]
MTTGVEIRDGSVFAAAVDDEGRVATSAAVESGGDAAAAALAALERVSSGASGSSALGIAASSVDLPLTSRVVDAIRSRHADRFRQQSVIGCGTAAALAESWVGAARGFADVVYFGVEAHAHAGIVRDGRPSIGAHGQEPNVGWLALNPVEREDYRKSGCLNSEVAAVGIVRRLVWRIKAGDRSRVQDQVGSDLAAITHDLVLEAARARDGVSISVVRDTAKYLGMAAANLVVMTDPAMLVLGGIMASAADLLLEPIVWELGRRLPGPMMDALKIATATLGPEAVVIGAARSAQLANIGRPA